MGSPSSEKAHVNTPISSDILGVACDPHSGQQGRCAPTTMGHAQEKRETYRTGEHVGWKTRGGSSSPIARHFL